MRTLQSQMIEKGISKARSNDKDNEMKIKQKKESLTKRELEELMGCRRGTYARGKGGAYKQKR